MGSETPTHERRSTPVGAYIHHSAPTIDEADVVAVAAQLRSGQLASGEATARFEERLGKAVGTDAGSVLAVASGTQALQLAIALAGAQPGDRVVVPAYACRALVDAVLATAATPEVVDVTDDYALDVTAVQTTPATLIAFHPFGRRLALEPLRALGCPLIEDCAHVLSASSAADLSVYSFHATKLLATGEGGAVVARSEAARERLAALRRGADAAGQLVARSFSPLSDLAASLGVAQLARWPAFEARRREFAALYSELLGDALDVVPYGPSDVPFRWLARTAMPFASMRAALDVRGVAVRRPVDPPLHRALGLDHDGFPVAERLFERTISLPLYPALSTEQVRYVAEQTLEVLGGESRR
jgi:dTDP-4-amino-4,6-dideoxygalactose transaminase